MTFGVRPDVCRRQVIRLCEVRSVNRKLAPTSSHTRPMSKTALWVGARRAPKDPCGRRRRTSGRLHEPGVGGQRCSVDPSRRTPSGRCYSGPHRHDGAGLGSLREGRMFVGSRKSFQPSPRHGPIFLAFRHLHAVVLGRWAPFDGWARGGTMGTRVVVAAIRMAPVAYIT